MTRNEARRAKPVGAQGGAYWTTTMTGMLEAYPVDESARLSGSDWPLLPRAVQRAAANAWYACHGSLAAIASERGGSIFVME